MGSVAERIFRQAPCPVLIVGPSSSQKPEDGAPRILVPAGFAHQSLYAVRYAVWLAEQLQSSLAVLHVVTDAERLAPAEKERIGDERSRATGADVPRNTKLPSAPSSSWNSGPQPARYWDFRRVEPQPHGAGFAAGGSRPPRNRAGQSLRDRLQSSVPGADRPGAGLATSCKFCPQPRSIPDTEAGSKVPRKSRTTLEQRSAGVVLNDRGEERWRAHEK